MGGSIMPALDLLIFAFLVAGLINPSFWIQKPELKNDPNEQKKMRVIAACLMAVEIVFCLIEYVF